MAATGAVIGVGGAAIAQESGSTTFELGGETSGWVGRAPSSIDGQTNPTLELAPGTDYTITWENTDGQPHNVVILDADENQLERTEIVSEEGATQTLEFTATEAMAEYLCEVHPTSMRGNISLGTAATEASTPTNETGNKTGMSNETQPEPSDNESQPEPSETPDQIFRLYFENNSWMGRSPSEIEGQTNPTLHLETGKTYRISWENRKSISTPADQRPNLVVGAEYPDGNSVVHTQYLSESGATQSADFVATDDLSIYYAEAYSSARGEISVSGATDSGQPAGDNSKAKSGNGKAKSGNGKAKSGNGKTE